MTFVLRVYIFQVLTKYLYFHAQIKAGNFKRFTYFFGYHSQLLTPLFVMMQLIIIPCKVTCFIRSTFDDCPTKGDITVPLAAWPMTKIVAIFLDSYVASFALTVAVSIIVTMFYVGGDYLTNFVDRYVY